MSYLSVFGDLAKGKKEILQQTLDSNVRKYVFINILILGILFGLSNFIGAIQTTTGIPLDGKFALITPLIFFVTGFFTMAAALFGYGLIYWAAAKAFGGQGGIGLGIELIGLTCIPFWIVAPLTNYLINYNVSSTSRLVLIVAIVSVVIWLFKLTRNSLVAGMGLTETKAGFAVFCMWIFSVSSIYVFLP